MFLWAFNYLVTCISDLTRGFALANQFLGPSLFQLQLIIALLLIYTI
jgi:hypothetical protein